MRVVLDGIPLLTPITGIGRYTSELARALKELPNPPVVTFNYGYRVINNDPIKNSENPMIFDRYIFKILKNFFPNHTKELIKKSIINYKNRGNRPHIYHATNYVADYFGAPIISTIHDLCFMRYPETLTRKRLNWLKDGLPKTIKKAKYIITISNFTKNEIVKWMNVNEKRIKVIYPGVNESFYPNKDNSVFDCLNHYNLKFKQYILTVGTLEPRKNILTLLEAYEKFYARTSLNYPLVIVGMKGWKDEDINRGINRLTQKNMIISLGYVPEDELPNLYNGAALFVFPSIYEGFGFPPLEAMACGVPTIVSNRGSLSEVVGNGGFVLDPKDIDKMSNEIEGFLKETRKREVFSKQGIERVKMFTWKSCAENTYELYQSVLHNNLRTGKID